MAVDWLLYLLPVVIVGTSISEFAAHGEKSRISKLDPEYAQRLFRTQLQRMFSRAGLCRRTVLYFQPPPPGLEGTIMRLRAAHLFSDAVACACFVLVVALILNAWNT